MAGTSPAMTEKEEAPMPAYWLARSKVNDPAEYKKYADLVPGIVAKYGGKFLARGGRYEIVEGPEKFHRFIVIEFPPSNRAWRVSARRSTRRPPASAAAAQARWKPSWWRGFSPTAPVS